jgi:hypothetical protein
MSYEVKIPDASTQYRKTPAWVRVFREAVDEQGQPIKVAVRRFFTEGTGDEMRVLRWHEALGKVRDFVENHTLDELKEGYQRITGEAYAGVSSKKGVLKGVLAFWFGFDQNLTVDEMKAWALERVTQEGRWGLGCPAGCGRFWTFKPHDTYGFIFCDPAAYIGIDEDGKPTHGYLQVDMATRSFTCDRCGAIITLSE